MSYENINVNEATIVDVRAPKISPLMVFRLKCEIKSIMTYKTLIDTSDKFTLKVII